MEEYNLRISNAKEKIQNADYIVIGAGAGLSVAAGLEYSGENFEKNYREFIERYNFEDLYSASFYPFKTQEEKWAFWAKMINLNRYNSPLKLYQELLELVSGKEYFVITTNVDGQFEIAGFQKEKIFETQGDYSLLQCENACHDKLYNNKGMVKEWLKFTKDCKVPSKLVPKCPVCKGNMEMNLRKDSNFVQDENWYRQAKRYDDFLKSKDEDKKGVFLEIGVGFNTPGIIRFPFEQMVYNNENTTLIRINKDYPQTMLDIKQKAILFDEDVEDFLLKIVQEENFMI